MVKKIKANNQGVILVFTLILLAVLLSTALSFSYLIINDINKARSIDDSIVAYYAADAGMEESLYIVEKQGLTSSLEKLKELRPSGALTESGGSWDILNSTDYEPSVLRQRLYNGQSVKFFILNRQSGNLTKSITLEWYKGANTAPKLQVSLTQLTPQLQQGDGSLIYYTDTSEVEGADTEYNGLEAPTCYNLNDEAISDGSPLLGPVDYVVEIKVLGGNDDFVDQLVVKANNTRCQDEGFSSNYNNRGITNLTLKSVGKYAKTQQSIIAHFLPKDPLSGVLGFVLFSEQDITKE